MFHQLAEKMTALRDVRNMILWSYEDDIIDEEECIFLYDVNSSKNLDYPYWNYERFDIDNLTDAECWSEFRFLKNDIFVLKDVLRIPDTVRTYNRLAINGIEALSIFLKRYSYPTRYSDMIPRFGRPVPQYSIISTAILNHIYDNFHHLLEDFNQPFLQPNLLESYCQAISNKGAALTNCFGFVDGTVRPICRPGRNQRIVYNGHKKVHSLKFQSLVTPNGLIANMYGPIEGRRHDCKMLTWSGLINKLQRHAFNPAGQPLCIYGDPAYPLRTHLQAPFTLGNITPQQRLFNKSMSAVRVSVEWLFGDILNWFAFMDFKRKSKIYLSAVGKMYLVCALLTNARTCMYGNLTSEYFEMEPPTIQNYFI